MVRQNWTDDDLTQRLQEHDPDALETLISRYSRELFYFIRLVLDGVGVVQDAEECVNDLFVAVWQEIDSLQAADENRQWSISDGNGAGGRNMYRRGGPDSESRIALPAYSESSMEQLIEQSERLEELSLALATLPELDRQLIYLRYFKFASTEELAAKTGLTRHAVDTRLWRARKSLREALKERAYEYERI